MFKKVFNPFKAEYHKGRRKYQVFFKARVEEESGYCSIIGVHNPNRHGGCYGCGQNIGKFVDTPKEFSKGWDQELYLKFIEVWKKFHLKPAKKGSAVYNEFVQALDEFPASTRPCPWGDFN